MRYFVFRRDRYAFEAQLAAADQGSFISPLLTTNDLPTATLAAQLWSNWLNDYAFVFDTQQNAWIKVIPPGSQIPGAAIASPAMFVNTFTSQGTQLSPNTAVLR